MDCFQATSLKLEEFLWSGPRHLGGQGFVVRDTESTWLTINTLLHVATGFRQTWINKGLCRKKMNSFKVFYQSFGMYEMGEKPVMISQAQTKALKFALESVLFQHKETGMY